MFSEFGKWYEVKDGDPRGYALFRRHYSALPYLQRQRANGALFCGPGEKMVLMTTDCQAVFVWKKFIDKSGQQGINCGIFRNEGPYLSSELILEAEQLAWQRWPGERLYTYVNPRRIKTGHPKSGKPNPGKCFLKAGWRRLTAVTTKGQIILEKLPVTAT